MSLNTILIIGSGPIVIGQACEFDYSGVQACKVLRREGYRVVLVNSNPATIMTDPEFADATYIEPLTTEIIEQIIAIERPDALLPTVGGQTGLNLAVALAENGVLKRHNVSLIGASLRAMQLAEDRLQFKEAMLAAGLQVPHSAVVDSFDGAAALALEVGYPVLVRPSYTLGGSGAGVAFDEDELQRATATGLRESPVGQVLIEESVLGWKEFELEVMRDRANNFVVVCSIENLDPMGIHTGDSITVAPAMTLTDRELQRLRDQARTVMEAVGVETGGSNVQFAVNPQDGRVVVIEMNPRVSRSSALASKATGFPIAKIAALLAVGHTLDAIPNDITGVTPASFEPSLDYVVVKIPRWDFVKFPQADTRLGPQMKSVGEVMAIGRTFQESLNKAIRGLETGLPGFGSGLLPVSSHPPDIGHPTAERLFHVADALAVGTGESEVARATGFDPWFVSQLADLIHTEAELRQYALDSLSPALLRHAKRQGFSDAHIAALLHPNTNPQPPAPSSIRTLRESQRLFPVYHRVDTCAAEFEAHTPYMFSTYETSCEADPTDRRKVVILGGGPNRIGQGIEFDYCCVHACMALRELGYETIMVNCNPETVSTDYDTADRLYFEPLTFEDVMNIVEVEQPEGVIVQFGGQTPINLTEPLAAAGVPIWGTAPESIALAEERGAFAELLQQLNIPQPEGGTAGSLPVATAIAERIGYPVIVRPSFVLGGRAMAIVYDENELAALLEQAVAVDPGRPVWVDRYLEDSFEVDVDAVADGERVVIGGVLQHIEEAGVHSGDSACVIPPYKISHYHLSIIREYTERLGLALGVRGLMNVQYAIKDDEVYVLEVNPRASRTVPFVSKATGVPLAKIAAQVMAGRSLQQIGFMETPHVDGFFVKECVLPFRKFPGVDARLGPEMRSTGEVMGHAARFGHAFAKAQLAAGTALPCSGTAFLSVNDFDKGAVVKAARDLHRIGFELVATRGTAEWLEKVGLPVSLINKMSEGSPHIVEAIERGDIALIVNTPLGRRAHSDGSFIRAAAVVHGVPLLTTLSAVSAAVNGIRTLKKDALSVRSLQQHFHMP